MNSVFTFSGLNLVIILCFRFSAVTAQLGDNVVTAQSDLFLKPKPSTHKATQDVNQKASPFKFEVISAPPGYEQWISPVVLPAPVQQGSSAWSDSILRAKKFVAQLTLDEKVNLTTGAGISGRCIGETGTVPRLGFNQPICLQDGPTGIRHTTNNSVFPAGINAAATFDKKLIYLRGQALGREAKNKGINVLLAPMANLMKTPESGRAWEGSGADPYLTMVATVQSVLGIQSTRMSACIKHYIGNEQEHYRGGSGAVSSSSNIDDRTLHELYDLPFAEAIRVGADYVMCSYNRVNQTNACENSKLINGVVKGEHGFQGVVVTDWAAAVSGVRTALAGIDLNMPGFTGYDQPSEPNPALANSSYWGLRMIQAVKNGSVPIGRLDDMVTRVISTYYKQGQDKPDYPKLNFRSELQGNLKQQAADNRYVNVQEDHYKLIREIGAASAVLLKNVKNALPLRSPEKMKSVVVIGSDAGDNPEGPNSCFDGACNVGTLASGWGSGTSNFPYLIAPATAIEKYVKKTNPSISYKSIFNDYAYDVIARAASTADVALVHVKASSGEGYLTVDGNAGDRNNLSLWNHGDDLITKTAQVCNNVVVVIHTVGPVDMEAWITNPNVTAVLLAGLPGQESGNSEVQVLWGEVNPSARLPYTIAKKRSDYPSKLLYFTEIEVPQVSYAEGLNIDYRHFDAKKIEPRFEYGFGLSYSSFTYGSLKISTPFELTGESGNSGGALKLPSGKAFDLYKNILTFKFQITNTGPLAGHEVAQLYVGFPDNVKEPPKLLKGFERVLVSPKESQTVTIDLRGIDASFWDTTTQSWVVPSGKFKFMIGSSSRKIFLEKEIDFETPTKAN